MKKNLFIYIIYLSNIKNMNAFANIPSNYLHQNPEIAAKGINFLTIKLPMLDTFGHKNLEFNEKVIPTILDNNHISVPVKVELITGLIKFSQFGDNFGSWIIEHYLQIITYLVNCL